MVRFTPEIMWDHFYQWIIKSELDWLVPTGIWTKAIKQFFKELAEEEKYACKYTDNNNKEYLVDLVWEVDNHKRYLPLCLECELSKTSDEGILEDFKKLVDIKAEFKIGIFAIETPKESKILEKMLETLSKQIYTLSEERYLVIFVRKKKDKKVSTSSYKLDFKGEKYECIKENIDLFKNQ